MATFFNAVKWSVAGELASRAIQPLVFVILARLLTPDAYGVMAAAVMVISFTQVFWEAGMSKAIIQRQTDVEDSANVAFWINIVLGIVIAVILFAFAGMIAKNLFQDARVANVLKVMTLQIFLGAIASVHTALLQKEMKFSRLFWVRMATVAIPGFFSIPLAWYGMSYWALVAGTLVGQAAQVIVLWKISDWRPSFSFNTLLAKDLGRFGAWVGLSGLLSWFYIWMDSLFVGTYLGTHELGLYRTGNQFVTMIFGFMFAPVLPVLYSHFSSTLGDMEKLRNNFMKVIRIIGFASIPIAFLLYALANPLSSVFFGEKWQGIGFVLAVMALMHGYSWIVGANGEIYRAIGKPAYETVVNSIALAIYIAGYFFSIKQGFEPFVWTRYGLALVAIALHLSFARMAINVKIFPIVKIIFLATGIGSVALLLKEFAVAFSENYILQILIICFGCLPLMGGLYFLVEKNRSLKDIVSLVKKRNPQ